jgi:hypothetical protein
LRRRCFWKTFEKSGWQPEDCQPPRYVPVVISAASQ